MVRRIAASFVLIVLASTAPAMAADRAAPVAAAATVAAGNAIEPADGIRALPGEASKTVRRGSLLPALYIGLAGLHGYDAFTTLKGVAHGATESNGMIRGAAHTPAAMWALKGGVTAGSILAAERLWRSGRRAQAIGMMVMSNAVMAAVGAHNHQVLGRQR